MFLGERFRRTLICLVIVSDDDEFSPEILPFTILTRSKEVFLNCSKLQKAGHDA